jgi:hypothetical protein
MYIACLKMYCIALCPETFEIFPSGWLLLILAGQRSLLHSYDEGGGQSLNTSPRQTAWVGCANEFEMILLKIQATFQND